MEIIKKAWSIGLVNTEVPTDYGGPGLSGVENALIGEALSYGCTGMSTAILGNGLAVSIDLIFWGGFFVGF